MLAIFYLLSAFRFPFGLHIAHLGMIYFICNYILKVDMKKIILIEFFVIFFILFKFTIGVSFYGFDFELLKGYLTLICACISFFVLIRIKPKHYPSIKQINFFFNIKFLSFIICCFSILFI